MNGEDWLFLIGAAVLAAGCFYAFSFWKKFAVGEERTCDFSPLGH